MPVHIDEINILSRQASTNADPNWTAENLTRHIRALWHHVERLESARTSGQNEVVFRSGDSSITLQRDGTIVIKGNNIRIEGSGTVEVKAAANLVMKGSKILEN